MDSENQLKYLTQRIAYGEQVMSLLIGEEMQISTDMRLKDIDSSIIIEEPSDYQDLR